MISRIFATVITVFAAASLSAERLDIPESNSQRILTMGDILASWPIESAGATNFARLFYVHAGGLIYLCRVEERNRNITTNCFARSTPKSE